MEMTETMIKIMSAPMSYDHRTISALQKFQRNHKYGMETNEERLEAMKVLARDISMVLFVPIPEVAWVDNGCEDSLASFYDVRLHKIVMVGKLSIITFLHEFAHAIYTGGSENEARIWSIHLFRLVYPRSFAEMKVIEDRFGNFILAKEDATLNRVVTEGAIGGAVTVTPVSTAPLGA